MRLRLLLLAAAVVAVALPAAAGASQLIDRNASGLKLQANSKGQALLTYHARGKLNHVLAWGAINALAPTTARPQVAFKLDYSGGWGTYKKDVWKTFKNSCSAYDGPQLGWFVTGCKASDGSYWAVQSWQKMLPNYGLAPTAADSAWEVHLSHWSGDVPALSISLDWAYRSFDHLFGSYSYNGTGIYGFRSTPGGSPLDTFGRNLYVDTFNSTYGPGWKRENSFLTHKQGGTFCYGFYSHGAHPVGKGEKYRATIIGPGVTPDGFWQADAPGAYDKALDLQANDVLRQLGDSICKAN